MGRASACEPETASEPTVGAAASEGTIDGFGVGVGEPAGDGLGDGDALAFTPDLVGVALGLRLGVVDGLGVGLAVGVAGRGGLRKRPMLRSRRCPVAWRLRLCLATASAEV